MGLQYESKLFLVLWFIHGANPVYDDSVSLYKSTKDCQTMQQFIVNHNPDVGAICMSAEELKEN